MGGGSEGVSSKICRYACHILTKDVTLLSFVLSYVVIVHG